MLVINDGGKLLNQYTQTYGQTAVTLAEMLMTFMEQELDEISNPSMVTLCAAANVAHEKVFGANAHTCEERLNAFVIVRKVWYLGDKFQFWANTHQGVVILVDEPTEVY